MPVEEGRRRVRPRPPADGQLRPSVPGRPGLGVVLISSELPELIGLCDRILVMSQGRIVGEVSGEEMTQERVMELATHASERRRA